jgi:hypothetical protein
MKIMKKIAKKLKDDNERAARAGLLEDLFYDFNRTRGEVYTMNFVRGIFFGFGSVLGGTVVIAILVWILGFFVQLPGVGQPIQQVQESIRTPSQSK